MLTKLGIEIVDDVLFNSLYYLLLSKFCAINMYLFSNQEENNILRVLNQAQKFRMASMSTIPNLSIQKFIFI